MRGAGGADLAGCIGAGGGKRLSEGADQLAGKTLRNPDPDGVEPGGCQGMTAGVVVVLGSVGLNFGAGMTGGAAYLLRDNLVGHDYNADSVRLAPIEVREELWLRLVLRRHVQLTGSPKAARLLSSDASLPFLRVEPLSPACTISVTWQKALARLRAQEIGLDHPAQPSSKEPLVM